MKNLLTLLSIILLPFFAHSQYWQQQLDYTIDVTLNEKEKTLDGFERIFYTNNSPDTLNFIWFHIWMNAYKNDKTAFSEQLLENGRTDFYFSTKEQKGYINRLDFKVDGSPAKMEDHPSHLDIVKLILPKPLLPGQKITITTPFHIKLPFNFSRGGYDGNSFQITQWYPKPAVYDMNGWHPMPYLDQGEFYSEFGKYDVRITVPKDMVVAATGELQDESEKAWLLTKKYVETEKKPASKKSKSTTKKKTRAVAPPPSSTEMKTLNFIQEGVHDFAWFADKNYYIEQDTLILANNKVVSIQSFFTASEAIQWKNAVNYAKESLRFFSNEIGFYPYNVATVVQGPQSFGGGMEYPTITAISPGMDDKSLDLLIAHELGHNWFYGILASNEREHPWMDEGINSFYESKYAEKRYGPESKEEELLFQSYALRHRDQPVNTRSEDFSYNNYGLVAYHKTAEYFRLLENKLGKEKFSEMMRTYFDIWKFRHPQPSDLTSRVANYLGKDSTEFLALMNKNGILPGNELRKGLEVISPFKKNSIKNWIHNPSKDILFISPAIGANKYDKFMLGAIFSNYKLPVNKFSYLAIPMYAFGSKQLTGLAKMNLSLTSDKTIRKFDLFLNGALFSRDDFADSAGRKITMQFQKLVPGFRLTFNEKNARSTERKFIQWKTFFINEESLRITSDTLINGTDSARILLYNTPAESRYVNQLQFVIENDRELYPFRFQLQVEQAEDFIKPTITANYFFNYPKKGGLDLRFFAGKFFYTGEKDQFKSFATERYHLNMTGPNGYEDYTYSNYFLGRSEFEGFESQQIMMRDGGFKVRTDLLSDKVAKTDDWLIALNLNTSIPNSINPLSVLPIKIPLHFFFDIGTYSEPWKKDSPDDRFVFNAGLHLPLFSETLNIYIPLFYNKVYSDYLKSTIPDNRFWKTISFTIDFFQNKEIRKLNNQLEF